LFCPAGYLGKDIENRRGAEDEESKGIAGKSVVSFSMKPLALGGVS
jgi:hypothetical protein